MNELSSFDLFDIDDDDDKKPFEQITEQKVKEQTKQEALAEIAKQKDLAIKALDNIAQLCEKHKVYCNFIMGLHGFTYIHQPEKPKQTEPSDQSFIESYADEQRTGWVSSSDEC